MLWEIETSEIPFTEFKEYFEEKEVKSENFSNTNTASVNTEPSTANTSTEQKDTNKKEPKQKKKEEQTIKTAPPITEKKKKKKFFKSLVSLFTKKKKAPETKKQTKETSGEEKKQTNPNLGESFFDVEEKDPKNPNQGSSVDTLTLSSLENSNSNTQSNKISSNTQTTKISVWKNDAKDIKEAIIKKNLRPTIPTNCSLGPVKKKFFDFLIFLIFLIYFFFLKIKNKKLIKSCFHENSSNRPSFLACANFLRKILKLEPLVNENKALESKKVVLEVNSQLANENNFEPNERDVTDQSKRGVILKNHLMEWKGVTNLIKRVNFNQICKFEHNLWILSENIDKNEKNETFSTIFVFDLLKQSLASPPFVHKTKINCLLNVNNNFWAGDDQGYYLFYFFYFLFFIFYFFIFFIFYFSKNKEILSFLVVMDRKRK